MRRSFDLQSRICAGLYEFAADAQFIASSE
jgi:hypothetical protein